MRPAPFRPSSAHLFVCTNARAATDPLGAGCGARGASVVEAMKRAVAQGGLASRVWVSRTHCLGVCPTEGAAVAVSPTGALFTEVTAADAAGLVAAARGA
ncbi:MAG: (2Fe-2S) ferredoxin domain-containing protein [Polyangiaceae bacterium]|nr:(2Fe-2S) ferredoxin domain-containing protein [Polyangiaceae bacterium]